METIDLSGPQGNAFYLLGRARILASQMGKDPTAICAAMQAGDYDHLVAVFRREFADVCRLIE